MSTQTIRSLLKHCLCAAFLIPIAPIAMAADTGTVGKILQILSVGGPAGGPQNMDERVYLVGSPPLCTGSTDPTFAYININDPNFKAIVANLLFAYASNKSIEIHAAPASISASVYCQIGYIIVSG